MEIDELPLIILPSPVLTPTRPTLTDVRSLNWGQKILSAVRPSVVCAISRMPKLGAASFSREFTVTREVPRRLNRVPKGSQLTEASSVTHFSFSWPNPRYAQPQHYQSNDLGYVVFPRQIHIVWPGNNVLRTCFACLAAFRTLFMEWEVFLWLNTWSR